MSQLCAQTFRRKVRNKHNVIVVGKTGVGKSLLGVALTQTACRKGPRALCARVPRLPHETMVFLTLALLIETRPEDQNVGTGATSFLMSAYAGSIPAVALVFAAPLGLPELSSTVVGPLRF